MHRVAYDRHYTDLRDHYGILRQTLHYLKHVCGIEGPFNFDIFHELIRQGSILPSEQGEQERLATFYAAQSWCKCHIPWVYIPCTDID